MPERDEKSRRGYSQYDKLGTEELERILRLDFQASEGGESDLDAILYISDLLAKRKAADAAAGTDAAWEQFQAKYLPYADGRSLYAFDGEDCVSAPAPEQGPASPPRRGTPPRRRLWRASRLRRLAVAAAILVACLFGGMMAAQAAGIDVLGAIARWTDETFQFTATGSRATASPGLGGASGGQAWSVLREWSKSKDLFPTWAPDGFAAQEPKLTSITDSETVAVSFQGDGRFYQVFITHYQAPEENTGTFEKDDGPVEEYVHNGDVFYIFSNIDTLTATSFDGEWMIAIAGTLTREEMKAIIDSIGAPIPPE